jgi:hypothetical protein
MVLLSKMGYFHKRTAQDFEDTAFRAFASQDKQTVILAIPWVHAVFPVAKPDLSRGASGNPVETRLQKVRQVQPAFSMSVNGWPI